MCLNLGCEIYHQETFWWLSQVPPYKYESILKTDYDHFFPTFLNSSLAKANNTHTALCNLCKCHCVSKERNWLWVSLIKWLTLWCRIILEKFIVIQTVKKFPALWSMKIHYCVPPLDPILSKFKPVHTFPPYSPEKYNSHCANILASNHW